MVDWNIDSELFKGYPHFADTANRYSQEAARFAYSDGIGWMINTSQFNGYAHPQVPNRDSGNTPFRFTLSDTAYFGWRQNADVFDYPHVYYRELTPPPPPPPPLAEITSIELSSPGRYVGSETNITVSLGVNHSLGSDDVIIQLYRSGTIFYTFACNTVDGADEYSHDIPASVFIGLALGSYEVRAKLLRELDDELEIICEAVANYEVVATPTASFAGITPTTIQLPITAPITITANWQVAGAGINRIQGTASLSALTSAAIDTNQINLSALFANVSTLEHGYHNISVNLTVTSNSYGAATLVGSLDDVLEVLAPIPYPEITAVTLNTNGRYVGDTLPITISVGLKNIHNNDSISIRLRNGANIFYEHTAVLQGAETTYSRTIAQSVIDELAVGSYMVQVILIRDVTIKDETFATYRVVAAPTLQLVYVNPSTIQLPMAHPETINVTFQVAGVGINGITGVVMLDDTIFSNNVNATATLFDVQLVGLADLAPRGYSVVANLTVTSNTYGSVTLFDEFYNVFRVLEEVIPIKRDLRSNAVYIYNNFTLVQIVRNYVSLKWVRRYNRSGEFTLTLPNTPENMALAQAGFIIAKDNDDEAGFIEDVTIGEQITVTGAFISKMLSFRVVDFTSEHLVNLQATVNQLIMQNYINTTPDRVIPGFRIADYSISTQFVLARLENSNLEAWLENQDIGFKVAFLPEESAFEFSLFDGRLATAEFCENFRNITDQQYFHQTAQARNVVLVEAPPIEPEHGDGEPIRNIITVGSAHGLNRREAYARAGRFPPWDFGMQFLRQNEPVESLDVKIVDPYAPFEYMADYDIGDIVTIISESKGVSITQNIMEISEYYDKTGFHIYAIFGRVPRNLLMELRDNNYRLDELENNPPMPDLDLELIKDLIIPPLRDEIFDLIEFPPLPDWLYPWDNFRELLEHTANNVLDMRLRPEVIAIIEELLPSMGGHGGHIILDRLPTQAQINLMPENAVVVVYNPDVVFTPQL